jgi:hypothetical protein
MDVLFENERKAQALMVLAFAKLQENFILSVCAFREKNALPAQFGKENTAAELRMIEVGIGSGERKNVARQCDSADESTRCIADSQCGSVRVFSVFRQMDIPDQGNPFFVSVAER